MRNLTTTVRHITEQVIRSELATCGILIVTIPPEDRIEEVSSSIGGRVPLAVAYEIYNTSTGRKDVRVGGESCLAPAGYLVSWQTPDGRTILPIEDKVVTDRLVSKGMITQSEVDTTFLFVERSDFGKYGEPYTTLYHIDSQEGLNFFVEILRKYRLV